MSEKEPTPPQAAEELDGTELESVAGGGIIDSVVKAVSDFFTGGSEPTGGGGSFGGGGAGGSW